MSHLTFALSAIIDRFVLNEKLVAFVPVSDSLDGDFALAGINVVEDANVVFPPTPEFPCRIEYRRGQRFAVSGPDIGLMRQLFSNLLRNCRPHWFAKPLQVTNRIIRVFNLEGSFLGHE
jgi:hypothetical protein